MDRKQFVAELAKLRQNSTYLSLIRYRNEFSELADYNILFHMSYENALVKSIQAVKDYTPQFEMERQAKVQVLAGYERSLADLRVTAIEDIDDAYTRFFDNGRYIKGVKMHTATTCLHLYGLINFKRVLSPGLYPPDTRSTMTALKDRIRRLGPAHKFRQFRILPSQVERISVEKLTLLPPS